MTLRHQTTLAVLAFMASCGLMALEPPKLTPIGYLRAECAINGSLSARSGAVVTCHTFNVSDAPVSMEITTFEYDPMSAALSLPRKGADIDKDHGVWGPPTGAALKLVREYVTVSGQKTFTDFPKWRPARPKITLFRNEGYARKLIFKPGWVKAKSIPAKTKMLVLDFGPTLKVWLPKKAPGAVAPGKPIQFDKPQKVYAPSARGIAYDAYGTTGGKRRVVVGVDKKSGLCLEAQLPKKIVAGQDLELIYLVGNQGEAPVWVDQNSLTPAFLKTTVLLMRRKVAAIDGEELKSLLDLYPERKPIPLFPGEYLSFKHVIPAGTAKLRKNGRFEFKLELAPKWYPIDDKKRTEPRSAELTSTTSAIAR